MRRTVIFLTAIFGCYLSGSYALDFQVSESEVQDTEVALMPFRACYAEESKVLELTTRISAVLAMLNTEHDFTVSRKVELGKLPELKRYEMCSQVRIELLAKELRWVSRRLWQLSIRLEEPTEAEVKLLVKRKGDLIGHLQLLRVFAKGSTPACSMHLRSFDNQVDFLDYGLSMALIMFHSARPLRIVPVHPTKEIIIHSLLDSTKSAADLVEIANSNRQVASEALPRLVSNWYAGSLTNFNRTVEVISGLSTLDLQVICYTALYDEMRKASHLETYELVLLVGKLKRINKFVTSAASCPANSSGLTLPVVDQYKQMVEGVKSIYKLIGEETMCTIVNVEYSASIHLFDSLVLAGRLGKAGFKVTASDPPSLFEISYGEHRFYSSDSLAISESKRTANYTRPGESDANIFPQWKLIPVQGGKQYRILNAHFDDVLYADKSEMEEHFEGANRRVLLARSTYEGPRVYEDQEALWKLRCI